MEKKRDTSAKELCEGFPRQFEIFVDYARHLEYEEDPKYDYLKNLLSEICSENGLGIIDKHFDWFNESETNEISIKYSENKEGNIKLSDLDKMMERREKGNDMNNLLNYHSSLKKFSGASPNLSGEVNLSTGAPYNGLVSGLGFDSNIVDSQAADGVHQSKGDINVFSKFKTSKKEIYLNNKADNKPDQAKEEEINIEINKDIKKQDCCCYLF